MSNPTKPKSSTSYKDTAFGIMPRSKVVNLETKAVKKAQEYIVGLSEQKSPITPQLIKDLHRKGFGFIFPD